MILSSIMLKSFSIKTRLSQYGLGVRCGKIVLCPVCAKDPLAKNQESIAAGNYYG
jgi:hypothetical protein